MPAASYSNPRSKLDRAIVAYLKAALPTGSNIYPANHNGVRELPNLTVHARSGVPEVKFTGTFRFQVRLILRAEALAQPGQASTEANRFAADRFYSTAVDALLKCAASEQNFMQVARNITDAGRALAPTHLILKDAGETAANGRYDKASATQWDHVTEDYSIVYNATSNLWQLQDGSAAVLYTCTTANFPMLAWSREGVAGAAPVPSHKFEEEWNNWDMCDFTCQFWDEASLDGGEDETHENAFVEIAGFEAVASPSAIVGYSNTPGE